MSTVRVVRVGERSPTTVVRIIADPGVEVVPTGPGQGPVVTPVPPDGQGPVVVPVETGTTGGGTGERWWQGEGPPPELIVGARVGDWYWDTVSGDVFELTEGV